ncbi:hypothetical protein VPH35_048891 [Triticum aestivum]|uniref:Uncharacterized protein n=1 Tax=Triticum aestivum TaxID=4565 RepID=A0A077RPC3_WHEAT|nr:unnamed protein product [Triticum aestivum]
MAMVTVKLSSPVAARLVPSAGSARRASRVRVRASGGSYADELVSTADCQAVATMTATVAGAEVLAMRFHTSSGRAVVLSSSSYFGDIAGTLLVCAQLMAVLWRRLVQQISENKSRSHTACQRGERLPRISTGSRPVVEAVSIWEDGNSIASVQPPAADLDDQELCDQSGVYLGYMLSNSDTAEENKEKSVHTGLLCGWLFCGFNLVPSYELVPKAFIVLTILACNN